MFFGIDLELTIIAVIAFVLIGVGLAGMILFTKAKLINGEDCEIKVNDSPELTIHSPPGATLLSILTGHRIPIPSPCGGKATCKQCRVQVLEGVDEPLQTDIDTFSKYELKQGYRLSCQAKLKHNMHVHVEESALECKTIKGRVLSNENVATFIKELIVEVPQEIPYRSGGYLQFHVPAFKTQTSEWKATMEEQYFSDWEKYGLFNTTVDFTDLGEEVIRAYSMASYPAEGKIIKFNIRIATPPFQKGVVQKDIPWGICSSYTFGLKAGDPIKLSGPYGESFMKQDGREVIFLIGGAGSSFGRSHIMHLFKTEKTNRKVFLWYGARSLRENIYEEDFRALEKEFPNFSYHLVLSEPLEEDIAQGWPKDDPVRTNYLFRAFEQGQLKKMSEPEESLFYVCGPPLHNKSVMKLLDDYGVPAENIVLDDFGN